MEEGFMKYGAMTGLEWQVYGGKLAIVIVIIALWVLVGTIRRNLKERRRKRAEELKYLPASLLVIMELMERGAFTREQRQAVHRQLLDAVEAPWWETVGEGFRGYLLRIVYHTPLTLTVIGTTCVWADQVETGLKFFGVVALGLLLGTWFMVWRAPSRRSTYVTAGWTRFSHCLGMGCLSFVRAPVSWIFLGNDEYVQSGEWKVAAVFLLAGFIWHAYSMLVDKNKPVWLKDFLYGDRWEKQADKKGN